MTPPEQSYRTIPLNRNQVALVDEADYENLARYKWYATKTPKGPTFYAFRQEGSHGKTIYISMHRSILGITDPKVFVDHVNHDGLDNRRQNLRTATCAQNQHNKNHMTSNTSGYKGVHWLKKCKRWRVIISVNGKDHYLGQFKNLEDAAKASFEGCQRLHGEFFNRSLFKGIEP